MASINSTEINLSNVSISNKFRNVYSGLPGTSTNVIYDIGKDGLTISLSGWVTSESEYSGVAAEFMKSGEQSLVVTEGWEYKVFCTGIQRNLTTMVNYIAWTATVQTEDPYVYSLDETYRTKTITTNNQTWTADNDSNPIQNLESASTVPNVEITGSTGTTLTDAAYKDAYLGTGSYKQNKTKYVLKETHTFDAKPGRLWHLTRVGAWLQPFGDYYGGCFMEIRASINGGAETVLATYDENYATHPAPWVFHETDLDIYTAANESLVLKYYMSSSSDWDAYTRYYEYDVEEIRANACEGVQLYNTADTTTKLDMCNRLPADATLRLNTDGTGTAEWIGHFSTSAYIQEAFLYEGITYASETITVGADGYIIYDFDVKYPIVGIPTFTALLSNFTGTPKVQIAKDLAGAPDVWYDIDDTLVDGTLTVYDLDNATSLQLAGATRVYVKILAETGESIDIESYTFNADINPSAASFPEIAGNGATNVFRCDQDTTSEMDCSISLIYSERRYG
jgi:hypothetical protein